VYLTVICSAIFRLPFIPIVEKTFPRIWKDEGSRILLEISTAISSFVLLGRLLNYEISLESHGAIRAIGVFLIALSTIYFLQFRKNPISFYLAVIGLALFGVLYAGLKPGPYLVMMGVLLVYVRFSMNLVKIYENWHHTIPIVTAAMTIGLLGSPGSGIAGVLGELFTNKGIVIGVVMATGHISLALVLLRMTIHKTENWISSDNLTRLSYSSGIVLFLVSAFLIGTKIEPTFNLTVIVTFLFLLVLSSGLFLFLRKTEIPSLDFRMIELGGGEKVYVVMQRIGSVATTGLRGIAETFESETGMLWTFVILLMLVLGIVNLVN
jgi:hypothetical protein